VLECLAAVQGARLDSTAPVTWSARTAEHVWIAVGSPAPVVQVTEAVAVVRAITPLDTARRRLRHGVLLSVGLDPRIASAARLVLRARGREAGTGDGVGARAGLIPSSLARNLHLDPTRTAPGTLPSRAALVSERG
jgi:hypothetical protein